MQAHQLWASRVGHVDLNRDIQSSAVTILSGQIEVIAYYLAPIRGRE